MFSKRALPFALAFIIVGGCLGIPKAPVGVNMTTWQHLTQSSMVLATAYWTLALGVALGALMMVGGAILVAKPSTSNLNGLQLFAAGAMTFFGCLFLSEYLKALLVLSGIALLVALLVEAALHRNQIGALWQRLRGKSGSSPTP